MLLHVGSNNCLCFFNRTSNAIGKRWYATLKRRQENESAVGGSDVGRIACPAPKKQRTCVIVVKSKSGRLGGTSSSSKICEHGRQYSQCKECGSSGLCEHGRRRYDCTECGGSGICEHGRWRSRCKECGGSSICEQGRLRSLCKECGGTSICTADGGQDARSAVAVI
jgi:hypothetical protein